MRKFFSHTAFCIMAILVIALCGCEDLGEYPDTEAYYDSFGSVVLIDGVSEEEKSYSVKDYFYNEKSREDFLVGDDGVYRGPTFANYVYVAIPFKSTIVMDTLALYMQSQNDVTVYISAFVVDKIPSEWQAIADNVKNENESDGAEKPTYDDPAPETRVAEIAVSLKKGKWNSFMLDTFKSNGKAQESIQINEGQYVLLQIRNNSGARVFDVNKQAFVDPITGLELPKAELTMTNLLVRALDVRTDDELEGGG
mgnify:CR=1 FL=1